MGVYKSNGNRCEYRGVRGSPCVQPCGPVAINRRQDAMLAVSGGRVEDYLLIFATCMHIFFIFKVHQKLISDCEVLSKGFVVNLKC